MKLLYELEDSIVGIIAAIFILIYAAQWSLKIPYFLIIFPAVLGIFLLLNILDFAYFTKDFHENVKLSLVSFAINIIDIAINLAFLSKLLSARIPFVSDSLVPLITNQSMYVIAAYLIIANLAWIYWYHKK